MKPSFKILGQLKLGTLTIEVPEKDAKAITKFLGNQCQIIGTKRNTAAPNFDTLAPKTEAPAILTSLSVPVILNYVGAFYNLDTSTKIEPSEIRVWNAEKKGVEVVPVFRYTYGPETPGNYGVTLNTDYVKPFALEKIADHV